MTSTAATIDVQLRANTAAYRAEMVNSARTTTQQLGLIRKEASQTAVSIAKLNRAAVGFVGFEAVKSGVSALLDAQKSIQQIHYGLMGATGSAQAADKAYGFVAHTAKDLGLNLEEAGKSFTSMSAAATANGIAMKDQQELFRQLSRSATVMHLTSEQMGRATTALGQSFSKGKFQAEELRQQLGEAIPGIVPRFVQAVAKMNEGTALAGKSFERLLQDGDLSVQKYLPAMIKALEASGTGAEEAAKGLSAELNRLSTAWFNLKVKASGGVFSDAAISSVRFMAENLENVAGAATVAASVIAGRLVGVGAGKAYSAVAAPISDRMAASSQASDLANVARERVREAAATVNQARESVRLTTTWKAQAAAAQDTARGQLAVASAAHEAAQRTLEHQQGAATLSGNLRAQKEAQAAAVVAQRNLERAQREYNAASLSGTRADAAATAAKGRLILAQEAASVATNNLTAARGREAAAASASSLGGMLAGGLRSAGSGLLALVGGPLGAAAIAIGGLGLAYADARKKSEDARAEFDAQVKSMDTLRVAIQDTASAYGRMDGSKSIKAAAEEWNQYGVAVRKADADIAKLKEEISDYERKLATAQTKLEIGAGGGGDVAFYGERIKEAQEKLTALSKETEPTRAAFLQLEGQLQKSMDPGLFEKMREAALRADSAEFNKLRGALDKTSQAALEVWMAIEKINSAGQDDIWKRQVDRLKRERGELAAWDADRLKAYASEGGVSLQGVSPASLADPDGMAAQMALASLTKEQQKAYRDERTQVAENIAAEKAWNDQKKESRSATRAGIADSKAQESQYTSITDRIKRQIALDEEQMGLTDDMTAAQKLQVVITNEMTSAKSKLSEEEQKRVKALLEEAVAQSKALAAQESAKKAAQDMLRLQKELNEAAVTQQQANAIDLAGVGTGSEQMERMRRQLQLKDEYDRRLSALNDRNASANNGNGYTDRQYAQQLDELDKYHKEALQREAQYQAVRQSSITNWSFGAYRAFEDYRSQAANAAELSNQAFTNAFQGMEDALVSFAMTGKLSFSQLANSIIADLARISAKEATSALFNTAFTAFAGPVGAVQREKITIPGFDGGGFTGYGGRLEPAGIVHKGEGVLNQEDMSALGGPSAFHALRRSLRRGYASGGIAGQVSAPVALGGGSGGLGATKVEINNYGSSQVKARQTTERMPDGTELRKLVIDIVGESLDGGRLGSIGKSVYGWQERV
ncbi:phage tail tape measure protein [Stenotrophomonas sp.]|uniref:phage tail tape measure protein n=1 Tax=Stenotrophomonas sp. TaxID=69392 RepID=UPI0028A88721|nr:phage tail tape measure protein [Stenotrophomonas sp.]